MSMQLDLLELCIKYANEYYDGHFTIMKFSTNYKFCFGTPEDRHDIDRMSATGKTLTEAILRKLLFEIGASELNK